MTAATYRLAVKKKLRWQWWNCVNSYENASYPAPTILAAEIGWPRRLSLKPDFSAEFA
jgi:hypothetical protein